jgi:NitT/TauT family transport system substrate-binding protein
MRRVVLAAGVAAIAALAAGCGSSAASSGSSSNSSSNSQHVTLRLGLLANITHASALVGLNKGFFTKNLGDGVTLKTSVFSSGTDETTALLAGQLDAAYVGPNPAINAWQKSSGKAIKIISGAASGGAALVVKPSISSVSQLKAQKMATPSLVNTPKVALRYYLKTHGLTTTQTCRGDVAVTPIKPNSNAVLEFKSGQIAGGWEPAPYDYEMVADGGKVLVNEANLWPGGKFVTTNIVVSQAFLAAHASVVSNLLKGQIRPTTQRTTPPPRRPRLTRS